MTHSRPPRPWTWRHFACLAPVLIVLALAQPVRTAAQAAQGPQRPATWPHRVLLTNDDGIQSPALQAVARALADAGIETYVAAPDGNRSGTGSLMRSLQTDSLLVEPTDLGPGIRAWAVDGFPADCVLFALRGPMEASPPDLVVSGPNEGGNVAEAWFISGTIGAARAAAFFGVPAVAISGANARDSLSVTTIARWLVRFVRSEPVRRLRPPQYLNVNVPIDPRTVRGPTVTERARLLQVEARRDTSYSGQGSRQRWLLRGSFSVAAAPPGTDAFAFGHDSISIQPLRVGEQDSVVAAWLAAHLNLVPRWPIADSVKQGGRAP